MAASLLLLIPAYATAFILGTPTYVLLRDQGALNIVGCTLGGYIIAVATTLVIAATMGVLNPKVRLHILFNSHGIMGAVGGACFWLIAAYQPQGRGHGEASSQ